MKTAIVFEATREGYAIDQLSESRTITVGHLKAILRNVPDETMFVLSHDNGYTFGSLDWYEDVKGYTQEDEECEFEECDIDDLQYAYDEDDEEEE